MDSQSTEQPPIGQSISSQGIVFVWVAHVLGASVVLRGADLLADDVAGSSAHVLAPLLRPHASGGRDAEMVGVLPAVAVATREGGRNVLHDAREVIDRTAVVEVGDVRARPRRAGERRSG
eukprot:7315412-Prymnesium_polylepis.1